MKTIRQLAPAFLCLLGIFAGGHPAFSAEADSNAFGSSSWSDNLRWTIDSSTQQSRNSATDEWVDQYVIGLDLHKVFSSENRDIGTLVLQPYFVWLPKDRPRPSFFDGNDATLTWRIANFNYIVLPRGRLNWRVGHFEIPFGLEQEINTNGTLRQYSNGANLGVKADWGMTVNGHLPRWQYEFGVTRGTGQEYHSKGDPHTFSGRIGTASEGNFIGGLSVFSGRVARTSGVEEKHRIGADFTWAQGPFQLMTELSAGKNEGESVGNWLAELNWSSRQEQLLIYAQHDRLEQSTQMGNQRNRNTRLGARWTPGNRFTFGAQLSRLVASHQLRTSANELRIHFRFRL